MFTEMDMSLVLRRINHARLSKLRATCAIALIAAAVLSGCSDGGSHTTHPVPAKPTATNTVPATTLFDTEDLDDGQHVYATFTVVDHHGDFRYSAQIDTIAILKLAKSRYPAAAVYHIIGYRDLTDDYGNKRHVPVLNAGYDRSTVDQINFAGILPETVWNIRDNGGGPLVNLD